MYAKFYGLRFEPFQLSPTPNCFFESGVHGRALSYLKFGLSQREGFIVITGEVGAGKTTLIQHLLTTLDRRHYLLAHLVSTQLTHDDVVRMVASKLGVRSIDRGKASLLRDIEAILIAARRQECRCLLMVDEAQNLSFEALEELRMLSNLDSAGHPLVQSFLVGQPQLRMSLGREEMRQLKDRVIASYHLGAIEAGETEGYINYRLGLAGWSGEPLFSADAVAGIHEMTGGIPRRINVLCTRVLFFGCLEGVRSFGLPEIETVHREFMGERARTFDDGSGSDGDAREAPPAATPMPAPAADTPEQVAAADNKTPQSTEPGASPGVGAGRREPRPGGSMGAAAFANRPPAGVGESKPADGTAKPGPEPSPDTGHWGSFQSPPWQPWRNDAANGAQMFGAGGEAAATRPGPPRDDKGHEQDGQAPGQAAGRQSRTSGSDPRDPGNADRPAGVRAPAAAPNSAGPKGLGPAGGERREAAALARQDRETPRPGKIDLGKLDLGRLVPENPAREHDSRASLYRGARKAGSFFSERLAAGRLVSDSLASGGADDGGIQREVDARRSLFRSRLLSRVRKGLDEK